MIDSSIFNNSQIHDYEIESVTIDNYDANIYMNLKDPSFHKVEAVIHHFLNFEMSHKEPWGAGIYAVSSSIQTKKDYHILTIELNSGDKISIQYSGEIEIKAER